MYHRKMIRKRNAFNYLRNAAEYLQSTDGLKDCEIPWDLLQINGLLRRITELEPVYCKKQQKKVPDQLLVCGIGDL